MAAPSLSLIPSLKHGPLLVWIARVIRPCFRKRCRSSFAHFVAPQAQAVKRTAWPKSNLQMSLMFKSGLNVHTSSAQHDILDLCSTTPPLIFFLSVCHQLHQMPLRHLRPASDGSGKRTPSLKRMRRTSCTWAQGTATPAARHRHSHVQFSSSFTLFD